MKLWRDRYTTPHHAHIDSHFTPHVSDVLGVIVFTLCVSVCVCITTLKAEQTDIQTWILAWRSSGRISRSSLWVKGQRSRWRGQKMANRMFHWVLRALSMNLPEKKLRNTAWGVFKAYAVVLEIMSSTFLSEARDHIFISVPLGFPFKVFLSLKMSSDSGFINYRIHSN